MSCAWGLSGSGQGFAAITLEEGSQLRYYGASTVLTGMTYWLPDGNSWANLM